MTNEIRILNSYKHIDQAIEKVVRQTKYAIQLYRILDTPEEIFRFFELLSMFWKRVPSDKASRKEKEIDFFINVWYKKLQLPSIFPEEQVRQLQLISMAYQGVNEEKQARYYIEHLKNAYRLSDNDVNICEKIALKIKKLKTEHKYQLAASFESLFTELKCCEMKLLDDCRVPDL